MDPIWSLYKATYFFKSTPLKGANAPKLVTSPFFHPTHQNLDLSPKVLMVQTYNDAH